MSILMSILLAINCKAATQDERAQMLLRAKELKVLKMKITSFSEGRRLEAQCEFELSQELVPKSCYKLKLSKEKMRIIDKACERASFVMKEEVETGALSIVCREFVDKKNKDIRYSKEEVLPENYILGE